MFETVYKDMYIDAIEELIGEMKEDTIVRQWASVCRNMKRRLIFKMADELRKEKIVELKDAWMTQRRNYWDAKEETDFEKELQLHWKSECRKRTNEVVNLVELMFITCNS